MSRYRMRCVTILVAGMIAAAAMPGLAAECRFSPESAGVRIGNAVLQVALEVAKSGEAVGPECEVSESEELSAVCSAKSEFIRALGEVATAVSEGCHEPPTSYDMTCGFHAFRLLRASLDHADPRLHWQVLRMMYGLCGLDWEGEVTARGCRRDVEEAALATLEHQSEPLIRQLALEILADGCATEDSRGLLEGIAKGPPVEGDPCQRTTPLLTSDLRGESFDGLALEYREGAAERERQLANGVLCLIEGIRLNSLP